MTRDMDSPSKHRECDAESVPVHPDTYIVTTGPTHGEK